MDKIKFAVAFSGGKDCVLALDYMIEKGHQPVCLLVCLQENDCSHMHNVKKEFFEHYGQALNLPIVYYNTASFRNPTPILQALEKVKEYGAKAIVTGDIFFENARNWNERIANSANLKLITPLWNKNPKDCIEAVVSKGYKAIITGIWNHNLPDEFLGKVLTKEIIKEIEDENCDITGENGEYHTMVIDGPIFKNPISIKLGSIYYNEDDSFIEINES